MTVTEIAEKLIASGRDPGTTGRRVLTQEFGLTDYRATKMIQELKKYRPGSSTKSVADLVLVALKKKKRRSIEDLSEYLDRSESTVRKAIDELRERGIMVEADESAAKLSEEPVAGSVERVHHDMDPYLGGWNQFGIVSDNHLCNKYSRLDVLEAAYDLFDSEGVTVVYNCGNWIDGEARFNKNELYVFGMDAQIDHMIEVYPQRKGIETRYIAGDDHEGWYQQRECIEIGRYLQMRARDAGRNDLVYLGYMEADVELRAPGGYRILRPTHPGGGTAYAISYKAQKYAESLTGGEKPAIVLQGHYHKFNYSYPREIHVLDVGTTCDQTNFMRKQRIQAHVGFTLVRYKQAEDGRIIRVQVEWFPFYDRKFYEAMKPIPDGIQGVRRAKKAKAAA